MLMQDQNVSILGELKILCSKYYTTYLKRSLETYALKRILKNLLVFTLTAIILFGGAGISALADSYIMTYSFASTPYIIQNYVSKTEGVLDTLSPSAFDAASGGTVTIHTLTTELVENMHSQGIAVTPFFSNHWDRTLGNEALDNMDYVTDVLAKAVSDYGLDGINVDIENVNEAYRDKYTQFVKMLKEKLPNSVISVAVAANPNNWTTGWHGSYDYAALAQYSDYLMIMAYDESYYGSDPGPVSSISFVDKSIIYALERTTADKLVLGVPLYGRYWQQGASVGGIGITMNDVETIIGYYPDSTVRYDETAQAVEVTATLTSDFKLWGGITMSPGTYTIWYDNLQSLESKISLVNQYGLKGLGSWALGQEADGFWTLCGTTLRNLIFSDITGHWAEQYIVGSYERGWLVGDNGKFRPDASMTRAEAATVMVRVTGLEDAARGEDFNDTIGHWASDYIAIARENGLISGIGDNNFAPEEKLTREQMAVIIDNAAIFSNAVDFNDNPFSDLSREANSWSFDSIIKMYHNGIITGYPDGTFRPTANISRAEIAAMIDRLAGFGTRTGEGPDARNYSEYDADGYNEYSQSPH